MRTKLFIAIVALSSIVWIGCRTHYQPTSTPQAAVPTNAELGPVAGKKFHVPVRITINAPDDMVGQNVSFWDGTPFGFKDLYHYPLRRLSQDCFNNVFYTVFDQPGGEVIDSFDLQIEPQISQLGIHGDETTYKLIIYVTFLEPGGKRLVSFNLDKIKIGPTQVDPEREVPLLVYATIKELAIESINKILESQASRKAISRFEGK